MIDIGLTFPARADDTLEKVAKVLVDIVLNCVTRTPFNTHRDRLIYHNIFKFINEFKLSKLPVNTS